MDDIRQKLASEKENLIEELAAYKEEDPYTGASKDQIISSEDTLSTTEGHDRIVATRLELKQRLAEVEAALAKIEKGSYGKCENCGKAISKERLSVLPTARYCLDCESKFRK